MRISYGFTVRWRDKGGVWTELSVTGCASADDAFREAYEAAKRIGYRRPKFWQIIRWITEIDYEKRAGKLESVA